MYNTHGYLGIIPVVLGLVLGSGLGLIISVRVSMRVGVRGRVSDRVRVTVKVRVRGNAWHPRPLVVLMLFLRFLHDLCAENLF